MGQTQRSAEAVDGTGLAVVDAEDGGRGALGRRHRVIDLTDLAHDQRPTDRLAGVIVDRDDRRLVHRVHRHDRQRDEHGDDARHESRRDPSPT